MLSRLLTPAFARTITRSAAPIRAATRPKSTIPHGVEYRELATTTKDVWLCDAGAYPIMVILSCAVTMCVSFTGYKFFSTPDNRVIPSKRTALMRSWH